MKLDILILAAHPDDAELGCGGTIARHVAAGYKVGIIDFTEGELGTRGTVETRYQEAAESSRILGVSARENLKLRDGFFENNEAAQLQVITMIRKYQPTFVLANAIRDRHSDHGRAARLAVDACFLSGLVKVPTALDGAVQDPWRPRALYHYIQSDIITPDFVVDVTEFWEVKMNAIRAFKSQFHDPDSSEPETYISSPTFLKKVEARAIDFGHSIGAKYGEGYTVTRYPGVRDLHHLI